MGGRGLLIPSALVLWAAASLTFAADPIAEQEGAPLPYGTVRVARPTILWRVRVAKASRVTSAALQLDGAQIRADYDVDRAALLYRPSRPLEPGLHNVAAQIVIDGRQVVEQKWRFNITPDALADIPPTDDFQQQILLAANRVRAALKLQPLVLDRHLCVAAAAHAEFAGNGTGGSFHIEAPGRPGFTSAHPQDRAVAFGYGGFFRAEVGTTIPQPEAAMAGWMEAVYHRLPFLDPSARDLGVGRSAPRSRETWTGASIGSPRGGYAGESTVVTYPADGQTSVPVVFRGLEQPSPLRIHPGVKPVITGYIVSLSAFSVPQRRLSRVIANLADGRGADVPCYLNSPANDDQLTNAAFLIPREPLEPESTYTAEITAEIPGDEPISRRWKFTTDDGMGHRWRMWSLKATRVRDRAGHAATVSLSMFAVLDADTPPTYPCRLRIKDVRGTEVVQDVPAVGPSGGRRRTVNVRLKAPARLVTLTPIRKGVEDPGWAQSIQLDSDLD